MTAEIAVLNKSAVALATDSAVTISAGTVHEKIYLSADKLFQLSLSNPIGVMIYNGMHFMQIPLHIIITDFRQHGTAFEKVEKAAERFLEYLNERGQVCSEPVKMAALRSAIVPHMERVRNGRDRAFEKLIEESEQIPKDLPDQFRRIHLEKTEEVLNALSALDDAEFIGKKPPRITKARRELIEGIIGKFFQKTNDDLWKKLVQIGILATRKAAPTGSHTGIVVAGYGSAEMFPTLVAVEISGMIFGQLKFKRTEKVDIDRDGERARVLPFAQKEMVERFLYGLDTGIQNSVMKHCEETISEIGSAILDASGLKETKKKELRIKTEAAELAFLAGLRQKGLEGVRTRSQRGIEDMVEFMPKPELATMAEALVNLTSIKRRVSRGMATVGGPIDVAVISKAEGFVWIKRKHYFPAELNPRYEFRIKQGVGGDGEHREA